MTHRPTRGLDSVDRKVWTTEVIARTSSRGSFRPMSVKLAGPVFLTAALGGACCLETTSEVSPGSDRHAEIPCQVVKAGWSCSGADAGCEPGSWKAGTYSCGSGLSCTSSLAAGCSFLPPPICVESCTAAADCLEGLRCVAVACPADYFLDGGWAVAPPTAGEQTSVLSPSFCVDPNWPEWRVPTAAP